SGVESNYLVNQSQQVMALEHLADAAGVPTLVAPVLLGPSSNFEQTLEIGKGTSSGVGPGMPVEDADGLVGSVVLAGKSTATVELLTDARSSVDVRFGVSGVAGISVLQGEGPGRPLAATLSDSSLAGAPLRRGEPVITSGLAAADYPAGIPVGTVASVSSASGGLAEQVAVTPFATPQELQYVAVMLWTPTA
ncbi:MAG TPA: rod shape-determining protein MreC, partial [Acidimicrobiales bacterium]|nr:rod shape-determining protein MreC [Acidimicrobiales bacterium]